MVQSCSKSFCHLGFFSVLRKLFPLRFFFSLPPLPPDSSRPPLRCAGTEKTFPGSSRIAPNIFAYFSNQRSVTSFYYCELHRKILSLISVATTDDAASTFTNRSIFFPPKNLATFDGDASPSALPSPPSLSLPPPSLPRLTAHPTCFPLLAHLP